MELNYLNVADAAAKSVKTIGDNSGVTVEVNGEHLSVFDVPMTIEDADPFSTVYLFLLQNYLLKQKRYFTFYTGYPAKKPVLVGFDHSEEFKIEDEKSNLRLARTFVVSPDIDTDDIVDSFNELVLRNHINVDLPYLKECVAEIIHNIASHSGEKFFVMHCDYFETQRFFDIAIGDNGYGIRTTLGRKQEYAKMADEPHFKSIELAFQEGVTSKSDKRGYGLAQVRDVINRLDDILFLSSGDGYYRIDHSLPNSPVRAGNLKFDLPGVQVLLRFRGK